MVKLNLKKNFVRFITPQYKKNKFWLTIILYNKCEHSYIEFVYFFLNQIGLFKINF